MKPFKLIVNSSSGIRGDDFVTDAEASAYFEKNKLLGLWGKEAHTIHHEEQVTHHEATEDILDENGVRIFTGIDAYDEVVPAWDEQVPAEYTYVIEDHTAEVEQERVKKETKHNDRVSRVDQLKAINWNTVDAVAELKAVVRLLVKEAIKDDE